MEIWKPVIGYESYYSVSSFGRIRRDKTGKEAYPRKILKQMLDKKGYPRLGLCKNGIQKGFKIHRLVARAFLGKCPKEKQVNHRDCNKLNNYVSNLEYVTNKENMIHAVKNGLYPSRIGEKNGCSKLTEKQIIKIREKYAQGNTTYKKLAKIYNISNVQVGHIIRKKNWSHILDQPD